MAEGEIKFFKGERGFGFISGDDNRDYFFHISSFKIGATPAQGQRVSFKPAKTTKGWEAQNVTTADGVSKANGSGGAGVGNRRNDSQPMAHLSPYGFAQRKGGKTPTSSFHHRIKPENFDIAFEVTWTTETPTALAPCEDPSVPATAGKPDENGGYNKRWLTTVAGHLAISPFTIKGAVANAFANLMGGCYRVPENEVGHSHAINASTFPYTGRWKRYRVAMNKSRPGIIRELNRETGAVKVQPVTEYYLDDTRLPEGLKPGDRCRVAWNHPQNRFGKPVTNKRLITPGSIELCNSSGSPKSEKKELVYYGPYRFGMNLELQPGNLGKTHHHRFYKERGREISGVMPLLAFAEERQFKSKVYAGQFCKNDPNELKPKDPRQDKLGQAWYEDLSTLKPGNFCYYTSFNGDDGREQIAAIGKNFQFKALFDHVATVPAENEHCVDRGNLCPRCSLFGLADQTGSKNDAVGYAGRFRSATLTSDFTIRDSERITVQVPGENGEFRRIDCASWDDDQGQPAVSQFVLPIMGAPKPSKRDQNGYFNKETGKLKGAKRYHHMKLTFADLPARIEQATKAGNNSSTYSHKMRPVAPACREGIDFRGTLGCENSSAEEAAGLIMLLDQRISGHRFKLGLGKSLGLGSVRSRITRIWVRDPQKSWQWQAHEMSSGDDFHAMIQTIQSLQPTLASALKLLQKTDKVASGFKPGRPKFPSASNKYWQEFNGKSA